MPTECGCGTTGCTHTMRIDGTIPPTLADDFVVVRMGLMFTGKECMPDDEALAALDRIAERQHDRHMGSGHDCKDGDCAYFISGCACNGECVDDNCAALRRACKGENK